MSQHYSQPDRETEPHALPDVEVWQTPTSQLQTHCGVFTVPVDSDRDCPACGRSSCVEVRESGPAGWYFWYCFPGCLPEGDARGPYATEQDAIDAMRAEAGE